MDRWPPYGGGREGRFDCIYIYIYITGVGSGGGGGGKRGMFVPPTFNPTFLFST